MDGLRRRPDVGCDLNGDLTPQLNELGVSSGFPFGVNNRYSDDLEWPTSNEYNVEFQHQLPGNVVVSAGYIRRETRRNIGARNVAVPFESYIPLQVTEANSGRQVTVYNQAPALRGRVDNLWDNFSELDSDFNGADITVNKRLSNRWSMAGGASFGQTTGDIYATLATVDLNNPNNTFRRGLVGNDVPWSYRMSGLYEFTYDISVSATAQYLQGFSGHHDRLGGQQHGRAHAGDAGLDGRTARHDAVAGGQLARRQRPEKLEAEWDVVRAADRFLQPDELGHDPRPNHAARTDLRASEQHPARAADQAGRELRILTGASALRA